MHVVILSTNLGSIDLPCSVCLNAFDNPADAAAFVGFLPSSVEGLSVGVLVGELLVDEGGGVLLEVGAGSLVLEVLGALLEDVRQAR